MSELKTQISEDIKTAMKSKDTPRLETLRFLQAAIKNREIEIRPNTINDEEVVSVLKKMIKQRKESIEQFQNAGRQDLADKETAELKYIEHYLPQQLSKEQIESIVAKVVADLGVTSVKDMGRVMKEVLAKTGGNADGKLISEAVKSRLN